MANLITHYQLTMLPQYSKQYKSENIGLEDGANEQLLARTSTETAPPTYPPSSSGTGARSNVQYEYEPVYPRRGDKKTAVGLMGRTKIVGHSSLLAQRVSLTKRKQSKSFKKGSRSWPNWMKTGSALKTEIMLSYSMKPGNISVRVHRQYLGSRWQMVRVKKRNVRHRG